MPNGLDSFYNKIIARVGLLSELIGLTKPLEPAEICFTTDDQVFHVGNGSSKPANVLTDKSTGIFDWSNADKIIMPGGLSFDKTEVGQINGVDLETINQQNGLITRTGNNKFSSSQLISSDATIIITNGNGTLGDIDVELNLNSTQLKNLIAAGSYQIYIGSIPPNNATSGAVFWDSDDDIGYMLIGDSNTGAWVDFTS